MTTQRGTVLVVESDAVERERYGEWLEASGFGVLFCPGPSGPDYTCVGARDGVCPLVEEADAVVLDMSLESEAVLQGTAAEDLLGLYLLSGARVIVLGSHPGEQLNGQLVRLHRHPEQDQLIGAVSGLLGPRSGT